MSLIKTTSSFLNRHPLFRRERHHQRSQGHHATSVRLHDHQHEPNVARQPRPRAVLLHGRLHTSGVHRLHHAHCAHLLLSRRIHLICQDRCGMNEGYHARCRVTYSPRPSHTYICRLHLFPGSFFCPIGTQGTGPYAGWLNTTKSLIQNDIDTRSYPYCRSGLTEPDM